MAKLRERVEREVEFETTSDLTFEQLVDLVQLAATGSKRMMHTSFSVKDAQGGRIAVRAAGPGGLVTQMQLAVTHDTARGTVALSVGDFLTTRPTMAGFIPVGPSSAPALGPARRFSETLRRGL
ncbi:hypothetical protein GCM10027596_28760 [Nocardioides korecus]